MNAATKARCRFGCPRPPRECDRCVPPALYAPAPLEDEECCIDLDDTPPPMVVTAVVGSVAVTGVVVLAAVSAVAWAAGVITDALKGRS